MTPATEEISMQGATATAEQKAPTAVGSGDLLGISDIKSK